MKPPDLQALVARFGTYDRITPEAWAAFDAQRAEWHASVRAGDTYQRAEPEPCHIQLADDAATELGQPDMGDEPPPDDGDVLDGDQYELEP